VAAFAMEQSAIAQQIATGLADAVSRIGRPAK
jgi:hypothetical protein